jgi:adenylosuccinate lyase
MSWSSPLSGRYASPAMQGLWGERRRIGWWRRLWLALMESQRELGVAVPDAALAQLRAHLDDVDLARAAEYERRLRHDVMAHIHHLGDQAPAARPFLHLGATSAFVTDNTDLLLMREALQIVLGRLAAVLVALGNTARRYRAVPCLAYTHFQPAQLTTVGKRVTLWMQDFALDADEILHRLGALRFRGVKGTTGTQASFLDLLGGDDAKVRELDARVARKVGFDQVFPVTGQTYTRKVDAQVLAALSGVAASAAKFATDLRLLQHEGEMLEPFEAEQVGSSAMPYKRNPMRAERITGLARFVIELEGNAWHTAATQWLERTLDDSANRRIVLPEAFLAADAILVLATNVAAGLEVREPVIARHVAGAMPFLATERLLLRGVAAGGDRQRLHEVIRGHSQAVAQAAAESGAANDLLTRLAADPAFQALQVRVTPAELDPAGYVGRAPAQVDVFLDEVLTPALRRIEAAAPPPVGAAEVQV